MQGIICSDTGNKGFNQDSACYRIINKTDGVYALAVVCDGLGGYTGGGFAGNLVTNAVAWWFDNVFTASTDYFGMEKIKEDLRALISKTNHQLTDYKNRSGIAAGTTLSCLIITPEGWLTAQVGDSRVYAYGDRLKMLTEDQSFAQRELSSGRMSKEELEKDTRKNNLLQCVGITKDINPVFETGKNLDHRGYLLCSDGFWHTTSEEEISGLFCDTRQLSSDKMKARILEHIKNARTRKEYDDITTVVLWDCGFFDAKDSFVIHKDEVFGTDR